MKIKSGRTLTIINIILPIVIAAGMFILLLMNNLYNSRERVCNFAEARREGSSFYFDDIIVEIKPRSGDSGSWDSRDLIDENGEIVYKRAIGTIYEMSIYNNSYNSVHDWNVTVVIPEEMCVNNTWNGEFEYHQNVISGNEMVQAIDLSQYSKYDIALENYMTYAGPLLKLYSGDRFTYLPNADMGETTIAGKKSEDSMSKVEIGFIMYVPNKKNVNYVVDFSNGKVTYHLQASIFGSPYFWGLCGLVLVWISLLISLITVKLNVRRYEEQQRRDANTIEQTMQTFVNFIEAKDPSTMGHSLRVAQYSKLIAKKMNFSELECEQIYWIALMHDCGKIYIPDEILSKPGKLTDEEYEVMKKHTVYGGEILRDFTAIENIRTGALCHHERYDGKGYPNGLAGNDIPIMARIICVSDSFDAMNSRRCYRNNLSEEVIISELKKNKGTQFDPKIIDCLLALIESGAISMSETTKGSTVNN